MPNMDYCMFENTYNDLRDCYEALFESGVVKIEKDANQHERKYIKKLIELCTYISKEFEDE
jgi:hypothetical protein